MNQLFVSFESQSLELLQKLSKDARKEGNIVESLNPIKIDEPYLMRLLNWADTVYCLSKSDKKTLSFMKAFKKKIQILNVKFHACFNCQKLIEETDAMIWQTDFYFCSEACQHAYEKECVYCVGCQYPIFKDDPHQIADEEKHIYCCIECLNLSRI